MDPLTIALTIALAEGLRQVVSKLAEATVDASLETAKELLKKRLQRGYLQAEKDKKLLEAVQAALQQAGAPVDDEDELQDWGKRTGLLRLQAKPNHALRRQVARAILSFTDENADPPIELVRALGWPNSQKKQLSALLAGLRASLADLDEWKDQLAYADAAAQRGQLAQMLAQMHQLDNLLVETDAGQSLRVVIEQRQMSQAEARRLEERYRADLVQQFYWHDFRGIYQVKREVQLPLEDIYLELGLLRMADDQERIKIQEDLMKLREAERWQEEERRIQQQRVTDALAQSQHLVILGEPGAGKTISLHFITLMLAYGYSAARLGLDRPYVPLLVRLANFARALEADPDLSLDNYLLSYIRKAYASSPHLDEFLRLYLEQGGCMILLDGMDEVSSDSSGGRSLRRRVVQRVQQFADIWCGKHRSNRIVVTSRVEGYWEESLRRFEHTQLSPLRPPEEVEAFLQLWYCAHEKFIDPDLPAEEAEKRARKQVASLLPSVLNLTGTRRLATNPLLLTILALIHENVGRLPNRRIKLYEIAAQTLIDSWRQTQTERDDQLLVEVGDEVVIRVMSTLAYWLHENRPGGTASFEEWRTQLTEILKNELDEENAPRLAERFLQHARQEAGLLAERGMGQYGFFHLTFEEYLAARQIARQKAEERCKMIRAHWQDPRWQEVILLAVGQLGIVENRTDEASDFIEYLLGMESPDLEIAGRSVVLAGRALADIGIRAVKNATRRWTLQALRQAMQDLDPEDEKPCQPGRVPLRTRFSAGEVLDELGWLPPDLDEFIRIPAQGLPSLDRDAFWIGKYLVTNAQYERFLKAGDFGGRDLWVDYPRFDEHGRPLKKNWGERGWEWLQGRLLDRDDSPDGRRIFPRYWDDPRFGIARKGSPVVGVTWFEANAYCRWLQRHWQDPEQNRSAPAWQPGLVRLPTEAEWLLAAGGDKPENRYPWDAPGQATAQEAEILRRANVLQSQIGQTTPVGMYPLGASQPYGLWDLAGNVWERQANHYNKDHASLVLRGGSWSYDMDVDRPAVRRSAPPDDPWLYYGFRVVALPS